MSGDSVVFGFNAINLIAINESQPSIYKERSLGHQKCLKDLLFKPLWNYKLNLGGCLVEALALFEQPLAYPNYSSKAHFLSFFS